MPTTRGSFLISFGPITLFFLFASNDDPGEEDDIHMLLGEQYDATEEGYVDSEEE